MPRLIVICVDGATPAFIREHGLFGWGGGARRLRSIYPSSTAPAHASVLTGLHPEGHGIVGNRFWTNDTRDVVRLAQGDPLACLHPYEDSSLAAPSVVAGLRRRGLDVAAVQFPHTFSRAAGETGADATFCLYSPSGTVEAARQGGRAAVPVAAFGFDFTVDLELGGNGAVSWSSSSPRVALAADGPAVDVHGLEDRRALSLRLELKEAGPDTVRVYRSTGVLTLTFGGVAAADVVGPDRPPHSRAVSYTANPDHGFHESPGIGWTTATACRLLERGPDVLLVRYSQVDHAQEHLHWFAEHGDERQSREAVEQTLAAYRAVEDGVRAILGEAGADTPVFVFSDHGIDSVHTHLHVNRLLEELGLEREFVFQGDSSCAYLYGDRPLAPAEDRALRSAAVSSPAGSRLWVAERGEMEGLRAYREDRSGRLVLRCAGHTELQYGPGPFACAARSASHGFPPDSPAMDGIWLPVAGDLSSIAAPSCVTDLAGIIDALCS